MKARTDAERRIGLATAVETAERVKQLAHDPAVTAWFDRQEAELLAVIIELKNQDATWSAVERLRNLKAFRQAIERMINDGRMAAEWLASHPLQQETD